MIWAGILAGCTNIPPDQPPVLFEPSAGRLRASFDTDRRKGHFGAGFVGGEQSDNSGDTWWALPVETQIYTPVAGLVVYNGPDTARCGGGRFTKPYVVLDVDPGLTWLVVFAGVSSSLELNTFIEAGTLLGVVSDEGRPDAPDPCHKTTLGLTVYDLKALEPGEPWTSAEPVDPWTTAFTHVDPSVREALMRP